MLFTSKNESDVSLKGQRIQRFLRENINHAKTRQVRVNSKRFAKFDAREGTPVVARHARWQAVSTENDWVWERKWHKCNKTYILIKAAKQSIIKNKQTTRQIVTIKINKQGRRSRERDFGSPVSVIVFVAWQPSRVFRTSSNITISYQDRQD